MPYIFILIFILIIEIFWSFGTANWGTAVRHHQIVYGLMLFLAFSKFKIRKDFK